MSWDDQIIGTAVRIELEETSDQVFLVFEITDPVYKQQVKKDWTKDITFRIINKHLVKDE
jgi:hypothetical protein